MTSRDDARVIVIGAGGAGLMAAMAAADAGAKVLHIEKMFRVGGCWAYLGGTFAGASTRIQHDTGVTDDSAELFYRECMADEYARTCSDPEVLMHYCSQAGQAVDWLDSLGAFPIQGHQARNAIYGEGWSVPRVYGVHRPLLDIVGPEYHSRVKSGLITLATNTRVTALIRDGARVRGVVARTANGKTREFRGGAVIVCTGGFGANPGLVRKYNLPLARELTTKCPQFDQGEGMAMCEEAGASLVNLNRGLPFGPYGGSICAAGAKREIAHLDMNRSPGSIWIDESGHRVINEDCGVLAPQLRHVLRRAPGHILTAIFDSRVREENPSIFISWFSTPGRTWQWFEDRVSHGESFKRADTIEELARSLDIAPDVFSGTVADWNACVDTGLDREFGRTELKYRIDHPPFYGVKTAPAVLSTFGGPATNARQQVIDGRGQAIPGLYAAGEVTGFLGYGSGFHNTGNIVFGKQAGVMAAREALQSGC